MPETERQRAKRDFEFAIAFGHNRTAITFALAEAQGEPLTLAELQKHTDVSATTVRNVVKRLEEMELVEETTKDRRMAFRFTEHGLRGAADWEAERAEEDAQPEPEPLTRAALFRWRVRGTASKPFEVDPEEVGADLAVAGLNPVEVGENGSLLVTVDYEIDALHEQEAVGIQLPSGWHVGGFGARATRIGLAAATRTRPDHWLVFTDVDGPTAADAARGAIARRVTLLREADAPRRMVEEAQQANVLVDYLSLAGSPEDGRLPVPDDDVLVRALRSCWEALADVGLTAVGAAFAVSERELRGAYAEHSLDRLEQRLDTLRAQGRLVP
ncbi:helix-turn-helix domain-containing protein [Baekduia sp. Peel2402]|uniref:helix-turn-helix domain-containing protein n=1 Tax=Baekduia sp. Peel2402 TaxID=3458296 RepID=UPI00403ECEC3